jgi:hypothetical protein
LTIAIVVVFINGSFSNSFYYFRHPLLFYDDSFTTVV